MIDPMIISICVSLVMLVGAIAYFVKCKRSFESRGGTYDGILTPEQQEMVDMITSGLNNIKK